MTNATVFSSPTPVVVRRDGKHPQFASAASWLSQALNWHRLSEGGRPGEINRLSWAWHCFCFCLGGFCTIPQPLNYTGLCMRETLSICMKAHIYITSNVVCADGMARRHAHTQRGAHHTHWTPSGPFMCTTSDLSWGRYVIQTHPSAKPNAVVYGVNMHARSVPESSPPQLSHPVWVTRNCVSMLCVLTDVICFYPSCSGDGWIRAKDWGSVSWHPSRLQRIVSEAGMLRLRKVSVRILARLSSTPHTALSNVWSCQTSSQTTHRPTCMAEILLVSVSREHVASLTFCVWPLQPCAFYLMEESRWKSTPWQD